MVARVATKFGKSKGPFAGTMLARACGLTPDSRYRPGAAGLVGRTGHRKNPGDVGPPLSGPGTLTVGPARKARSFSSRRRSTSGEDSARNWYGLALAHWRLGRFEEAGRWIEKAENWMIAERVRVCRSKTHPSPPIYITDWLETEVLRREAAR